jgi:3-oxoacyl-[acyl-carrier-protein] synthase III
MIRLGRYKTALVVSSNISSSELVAEYYNQPLIKKEEVFLRYFLSDGAGALILQAADNGSGIFIENAYIWNQWVVKNLPACLTKDQLTGRTPKRSMKKAIII